MFPMLSVPRVLPVHGYSLYSDFSRNTYDSRQRCNAALNDADLADVSLPLSLLKLTTCSLLPNPRRMCRFTAPNQTDLRTVRLPYLTASYSQTSLQY
jgi:hypothetical protein